MALELTTLAARPDLVGVVADWYLAESPAYFADVDAHALVQSRANADALPITLIVTEDGDARGAVALTEQSIDAHPELGPWVAGLFVHPDFRGRGIGQLLVASALRVAWAMGHERVYTGTNAVRLFAGLGFVAVGDSEQNGEKLRILVADRPAAPPSFYDEIGGEDAVRTLVDRFYDLMDVLPQATEVRAMHARSLKSSRQKLFEFLSGWMGGPNLYIEKYGHPRLRARHLPFSIGTDARDQWLACMDQALEETVSDARVRAQIRDSFVQIADHMRNRPGP